MSDRVFGLNEHVLNSKLKQNDPLYTLGYRGKNREPQIPQTKKINLLAIIDDHSKDSIRYL
jgi:hypothetical protein